MLTSAIACRYVDDYYGIDKQGTSVTGGVVTSILLSLIVLPADVSKSDDFAQPMVVLGIQLTYIPRLLPTTGEV